MGLVASFFGLATAAVVAMALATPRRRGGPAVQAAALTLAAIWLFCRLSEMTVGWDMSPDAFALLDVIGCASAVLIFARWGGPWLVLLALTYTAQSLLHVIYHTEWRVPGGVYTYVLGLNILYAIQLLVVAYGGRHAAAVLRDLGRDLLGRLRRVGPAVWVRSRQAARSGYGEVR